jgi:hypothetical protein
MEIVNNVLKWFAEHHSIRKGVKYAVFGGLLYVTGFLQTDPAMQATFAIVVLSILHNWAKHNLNLLDSGKVTGKKKK